MLSVKTFWWDENDEDLSSGEFGFPDGLTPRQIFVLVVDALAEREPDLPTLPVHDPKFSVVLVDDQTVFKMKGEINVQNRIPDKVFYYFQLNGSEQAESLATKELEKFLDDPDGEED